MREKDYYADEVVWRRDIRYYCSAFVRHWVAWTGITISGSIPALLQWLFAGKWSVILPWGLCIGAFSGVVAASFLAFRDQRRLTEEREAHLLSATGLVNDLKAQIDVREKRKRAKRRLGEYYMALQVRENRISEMAFYDYVNKYREDFELKRVDCDSGGLIDEITGFLQSEMDGVGVPIFLSNVDWQYHASVAAPEIIRQKEEYHGRVQELLRRRAALLMEVIKALPDSSL